MKARYIIESQRWEKIPVGGAAASPSAADASAHAGMPGMDHGGNANADELLAAGIGAAKLGDLATAERARAELRALRERTEAGPTAYRAKPMAILEREVGAHIAMAGKQGDEALRLMKEAADIELTLDKPSGPPEPIKPATELYGEMLLELGRPKEAAAQFEQSLLRIPKRTPSLFGLARAAAKAGDRVTAQRSYSELVKIWSAAGPGFTPLAEAQQFLKSGSE
jgi:predicted Zn-dependent protease